MPRRVARNDERGQPDQHGAGDEDAAAAEQVGGAAAEQHEAAVGEQVAAGDPLQALDGEVKIAANRGKRDVDDRSVDEVQEPNSAEEREDELPLTGGENGRLRRG